MRNRALLVVCVLAVVGLVGSWWWVHSTVPVSSFELTANGGDAAGVSADTTFTLKSSNDLDADTVRENLKTDPAVDFDVKRVGRGSYELTPVAGLPENRVLAIAVDDDITDQSYGWAFMVKAPMAVVTALPRNQATGVPVNTGIELTFNRSGITDPDRYISIEPAVKVRFESEGSVVTLVPLEPLKQATVYTVTVRAGLGADDTDDTLADETVIRFETESETQSVGYGDYFYVDRTFWDFPENREPAFGVQAYAGTTQVRARAYRFADADDFIAWYTRIMRPEWGWSQYNRTANTALPAEKQIWDGSVPVERGELSTAVRIPVQLGAGFYVAQLDTPNAARPTFAWFQMTPIASYLAVSGDRTLVALRSTVSGEPVSGAEVSYGGAKVGTSGSDGVALFDTPENLVQDPTGKATVVWGSAENFLTVRGAGTTLIIPVESQYGWYWRITPPERFWSYVSQDKTIYQPTDTLRFWGVVKQRNGDDMRGKTVTIQIEDGYWFDGGPLPADSTVYARTTGTISDFYTLTGALQLSGLEPRTYQLVVRMGNEVIISDTITVQAYVKPAYKIEIEPSAVTMFAGNPLSFNVRASFFDGTPVDRLAVTYDGWDGSGGSYKGSLRLDDQGRGSFTVDVPYREQQYWPSYLSMRVAPEKAEEGDLSATTWVNVFGPSVYLNVNQESRSKGTSEHFDLKLRSIDLDAARQGVWFDPDRDRSVPNASVDVAVTEITYRREQTGTGYDAISKTTYPIYRYWDERRSVHASTLTTDGSGETAFDFDLADEKGYEFVFSARDAGGRLETQRRYAYRTAWAWSQGIRQGIGIRIPGETHEAYGTGDPIRAEMYELGGRDLQQRKNGFLFLRLVNGLASYVAQDTASYTDEFRDEYVPNLQVMGVYFDGTRFLDTPPLNYAFDSKERKLDVEVSVGKDRYRPGERASLDISVTDRDGKPVSAEVNVSALDEAVFSLRPDARDFLTYLYRGVYVSVLTRSSHQEPVATGGGAERGGCFLAGTDIRTADGMRDIERIRVGDRVVTLAPDGSRVEQSVVRTSTHIVNGYLVINERLRLSVNHRLWVNGEWREAGTVRVGDTLMDEYGAPVAVTSVRSVDDRVRVYNFEVQPAHTYIAEGIWVHNEEKGGAEVRTDFKDQALFTSVRTGGNGRATVEVPLPDSITSWRVTVQAVTRDLRAGSRVQMIPVGLPFFVDATLNRSYLTGDHPILRARTFGTDVPAEASYAVEALTLPVGTRTVSGGRQVELDLGELSTGKHEVTIAAQGGGKSDAIRRTINVVDSYFARRSAGFYRLSDDLANIEGTANGHTNLTFMSLERGKVFATLAGLSWGAGSRLDAVLANRGASLLLRDVFGETDVAVGDVNATAWQLDNGGMALLPYSGDDLELSAKVADVGPALGVGLATDRLRAYFQAALTDEKQDIHRRAVALYGLAALREPYLREIRAMASRDDLDPTDTLYISLALDRIGAKNEARVLWAQRIQSTIEHRDDQAWVAGGTQEEMSVRTALAAWLAAGLQHADADGLKRYIDQYPPARTLVDLERFGWARDSSSRLRSGPVSFTYTVDGASERVSLDKDETFSLTVNSAQLASLRFSGIDGAVGLTTAFTQTADPDYVRRDPSVGISRRYRVGGNVTTVFREGDVVEIELTPNYSGAPAGGYEITDFLPSGLRAIEGPPPGGFRWSVCVAWPLQVSDQRVSLFSYNDPSATYERCRTVSYYARIVSKGSFRAEPALIQRSGEPGRQNVSAPATVTIQ